MLSNLTLHHTMIDCKSPCFVSYCGATPCSCHLKYDLYDSDDDKSVISYNNNKQLNDLIKI